MMRGNIFHLTRKILPQKEVRQLFRANEPLLFLGVISQPLLNRQFPILPGRLQPSTFGLCVLNCCVRNGNRWIHAGIITGCMKDCSLKTIQKKLLNILVSFKSSPRRISIGLLHPLRNFHSQPINLVVFKAPYQLSL